MSEFQYLIPCALILGCIMSWAVGANDLANSMGSSVGAKSISVRTAVILAAIFEGSGALLASGSVTSTLKESLFVISKWDNLSHELAFGMLSALIASSLWLLVATRKGWPVSTTHTIVGAIIGFSLVAVGVSGVRWIRVLLIILSWFVTPFLAGLISYVLLKIMQDKVFGASSPLLQARTWLPLCATSMMLLIGSMTIWGCLPKIGIRLDDRTSWIIMVMMLAMTFISSSEWILRLTRGRKNYSYTEQIDKVEKGFGALTVFTACAMAFSHGGNDISNALGPIAAIVDLVNHGKIMSQQPLSYSIVVMGAVCVVLGLAMYGYRIMNTIGNEITNLTPSRAFTAEFSTALVVMTSTVFGAPVSTTQTLVGAILGVGMARGVGAINLNVVRTIVISWAFTLPMGALLSAGIFIVFRFILL